jgi:hypothetical protein
MNRTVDPPAGFRLLWGSRAALGPRLSGAVLLSACLACGGWVAAEEPKEPKEPKGVEGVEGVEVTPVPSEGAKAAEGERLPELPPDKLPPRTRRKPDPAKDSFQKPKVFTWVEERVTPSSGQTYEPEVRVTESYLRAYLRRAGHPIAGKAEEGAIRLEGEVKLGFHSELTALGRKVGWKYRGEASFRVFDANGEDLGSFEVPEFYQENVRSEESAVLNARRLLAKMAWENLYGKGSILGNQKVVFLIGALAIEDSDTLGLVDSGPPPKTAEDIVAALAEIGFEAVPYLLEALTDERVVRIPSRYPGLAGGTLNLLKVYHVADKALEEIFQKVSRMDLGTPFRLRMVILKGWEKEWRRFCPSFAEEETGSKEEGKDEKKEGKMDEEKKDGLGDASKP